MEKKLPLCRIYEDDFGYNLSISRNGFQSTTIGELGVSDLITIHKELSSYLYKLIYMGM